MFGDGVNISATVDVKGVAEFANGSTRQDVPDFRLLCLYSHAENGGSRKAQEYPVAHLFRGERGKWIHRELMGKDKEESSENVQPYARLKMTFLVIYIWAIKKKGGEPITCDLWVCMPSST